MSTTRTSPATPAAGDHPTRGGSRVRRLAAAHPVAVYLAVSFTLTWAILFPLTLNGLPPEPGLIAVVLFAMLVPACLVTAASGGRAAVRELLSRTFRWRVHPVWYVLAVLTLPIVVVAAGVVAHGTPAIDAVADDPGVVTTFLLGLLVVPLINLWEETGWMGFVQARLEQRHGPLLAAAITGVLFATLHLPLFIGDGPVLQGIGLTALVALILGIPVRILFGWLYHRTGASVLLVAIAHAALNAANDGPLTLAVWPDAPETTVVPAVVGVLAVLVVALTKGRLGADRAGIR